jgi:hypothetical protein
MMRNKIAVQMVRDWKDDSPFVSCSSTENVIEELAPLLSVRMSVISSQSSLTISEDKRKDLPLKRDLPSTNQLYCNESMSLIVSVVWFAEKHHASVDFTVTV